ncbi:MAG TPA: glycosyltransferase family 4 protein [Anaerolineae bacterium]|nr:glycosyltransferase family 4 protein [Anaerolineae bacterium]HOQ98409.1 glycosyltransferase family 4 protein [Anaerolineae bacterium]HPL26479.1 glycosyltransferase family 4 protein [Anaerolineae bacterium]
MRDLVYACSSRIPASSANSIQVMRMSAALADLVPGFRLLAPWEPFSYLREKARRIDIRAYYGLHRSIPPTRLYPSIAYRSVRVDLYTRGVVGYLARQRPPAVYTRSPRIAVGLIGRGVPTALEAHEYELYIADGSLGALVSLSAEPAFLGVVAISAALAGLYERFGFAQERLLVAHDGIQADLLRSDMEQLEARRQLYIDAERRLALYAGTLADDRGLGLLMEVAHAVPEVQIMCLGGKPRQAALRAESARRRGPANIEFRAAVAPAQVAQYLAAADILLAPYTTAVRSAAFMSPLKVFEYMAAARPIVASDLPPMREILSDSRNALLVAPDDTLAIANAIRRLLSDASLALRLGRQARLDVGAYTWDRRAQRVVSFLEQQLTGLQAPACTS